jgi:hypothetical protein
VFHSVSPLRDEKESTTCIFGEPLKYAEEETGSREKGYRRSSTSNLVMITIPPSSEGEKKGARRQKSGTKENAAHIRGAALACLVDYL